MNYPNKIKIVGKIRIDRSLTSEEIYIYHIYYGRDYIGNACKNPPEETKLNLRSYTPVSIIKEILQELEQWEHS